MKNTLLLTIGLIAGFLINVFLQPVPDPISLQSKVQKKTLPAADVNAEISQLKKDKNEILDSYKKLLKANSDSLNSGIDKVNNPVAIDSLKANSDSLNSEIGTINNSAAIDSFRDKSFVYDSVNNVIKLQDPSKSVFIPSLGLILVDKKESIASGLKSINSETAAILRFENTRVDPVHLFWIDYTGKPVLYKTISPGEDYKINTYLTHPWVATDINGNRIGDIEAELAGKTEVIPLDR